VRSERRISVIERQILMQRVLIPVKAKFTYDGEDPQPLLETADAFRNLFAPRATQSELRRSTPQGWHIFVVIYPKEPSP
jgi:hypothetical protein